MGRQLSTTPRNSRLLLCARSSSLSYTLINAAELDLLLGGNNKRRADREFFERLHPSPDEEATTDE